MVKDMTKGKPIPIIIGFCIPMILGNIFQQLYNMVDSIIVGQFVGVDALAAVGATGSINFLVIGFVLGITSGFCIPIAQRFGAGNVKEMRRFAANALYLAIFFTVVLTTVTMIFTKDILRLMDTPEDIIDQSYSYIIIIFGGIVVIMFYNLFSCILRALGDSRTPLYFLAVASILNIILDLLFVLGFNMGVSGAGYATVISQGVSVLLCIIYIRRNYPILRFNRDELKPSFKHCGKQLSIGIPMALQFSITAIGSIIMQTAINGLGTVYVASVTTANKISMLICQPMETMGITMATYCGQNLGANKLLRIRKGVSISLRMQLIYCAFASLVLWFLGKYLAMMFISTGEVVILENVQYMLRIFALMYPTLALLFIFRSSLQGLGYSFIAMFAGVAELAARAFTAFVLVAPLGFLGVALSGPVAWLLADVMLIPAYFIIMSKLKKIPRKELSNIK